MQQVEKRITIVFDVPDIVGIGCGVLICSHFIGMGNCGNTILNWSATYLQNSKLVIITVGKGNLRVIRLSTIWYCLT